MPPVSIEPNVFWAIVALGGFAFVLLPLLLSSPPAKDAVQSLREQLGLSHLSWHLFLLAAAAWALILALLLFGLAHTIWDIIWQAVPNAQSNETQSQNLAQIWEFRFSIARLAGLTATIGAVIALPFTLIRLRLSHQQNETATEALFNDKLNAATEDLHAMRQRWDGEQNIWEDDITRRNAAIDRLEGLANERPDIAPRISRQLSVYVRELSTEAPPEDPPATGIRNDLFMWANGLEVQRSDMESAVQVLGRLKKIPNVDAGKITIDLRRSNLQGFDLQNLQFDAANFDGAMMQGADFTEADMKGSILWNTGLQGTYLDRVHLQGADLRYAKLQTAFLTGAVFSKSTNLSDAVFSNSAVASVDFTSAEISHAQINSAFGDASTRLPDGSGPEGAAWPNHWPKQDLGTTSFLDQWEIWVEDPENYTPPEPPKD